MKSILDPTFPYTSSVSTDLKKTFARIRRQQKAKEQAVAAQVEQPVICDRVVKLTRSK